MSGPSAKIIAPRVSAIRQEAAALGRNPAEILMFTMMTIILGNTEAEAAGQVCRLSVAISARKARWP